MAVAQLIDARCCVECGTDFEVPRRCGRPRQRCLVCSPERLDQRNAPKRGRGVKSNRCTCRVCGEEFLSRKLTKATCSSACRWRLKNPESGLAKQLRHDASPLHRDHQCEGCGISFRPKRYDRTRFCSRECFFSTLAQQRQEREDREAPTEQPGTCIECGAIFTGRKRQICSDDCRRAIARRKANKRNADKMAARVLPPRTCQACEEAFTPDHAARIYCSRTCANRARRRASGGNSPRRRARHYGVAYEPVNPVKVFDRDAWRCQECKRATPAKRRGTLHPAAPEIDHIVPLSRGGEHSYRNTQCLCRSCNAAKSNSNKGQLRLFG